MVRRTKAEAEQTRHKLLDAAEQLFLQRGVSRTSLNDIATAAGTTRGAIYWHFQDKADLFNAMMERVTLPLEQALQSAAQPGTDAQPPLKALLGNLMLALTTRRPAASLKSQRTRSSTWTNFTPSLSAATNASATCS